MSSTTHELYQRHRLAVHDYHRMGETGVFPPGCRVELIEGEVIDMVPIGSRHAAVVKRLNTLLVRAVGDRAVVSVQDPIIMGDYSEPEPDIALVRTRDDYYALAHPRADDVLLIIEVADSSLNYDRRIKIPLYARHEIPEVWLVDIEGRSLSVLHSPTAEGYEHENRLKVLGSMSPLALPEINVDLSRLF